MGFRITTNMMMNTYRYNLQNSTKRLSDARDMVLTQRTFSSYAEDPATATLAFRLRRSYLQTSSHLANTKDVYSKFNTAWHNLAGVVEDLSDATARVSSIRGNNGATGEGRRALAIDLRETANSVIQAMNQKLGDHFIFGGNDALNPPFSWSDDGKTLYYRGVPVNGCAGLNRPSSEPIEVRIPFDDDLMKAVVGVARDLKKNGKTEDELDPNELAWYKYFTARPGEEVTLPTKSIDGTQDLDTEEDFRAYMKGLIENGSFVEKGEFTGNQYKASEDAETPSPEEIERWLDYYMENGFGIKFDVDVITKKLTYKIPEINAGGSPLPPPLFLDKAAGGTSATLTGNDKIWYDFLSGSEYSAVPDPSTRPDWVDDLLNPDTTDFSDNDYEWLAYFKDRDVYVENYAILKRMSGEEMYIDLGMGAAEFAPNSPIKGTYFNNALCGIDFLGFGVDEDGDPKNLALIMRELADVFETWDEDTQSYNPALAKDTAAGLTSNELEAKALRLMDKLKAAQEHTTEMWVELDAQSVYLQASETRLNTQLTDLNIQILDIEQVDLADAITTFSWEQYCYNAALKIGNQLLSQSLIDYMN